MVLLIITLLIRIYDIEFVMNDTNNNRCVNSKWKPTDRPTDRPTNAFVHTLDIYIDCVQDCLTGEDHVASRYELI